jgi:hypothetical protein
MLSKLQKWMTTVGNKIFQAQIIRKILQKLPKMAKKMLMISKHGNCMTTVGKMFLLAQKKSKKNSKNGKKKYGMLSKQGIK